MFQKLFLLIFCLLGIVMLGYKTQAGSLYDPWGHNSYDGFVAEDPQSEDFILKFCENSSEANKKPIDESSLGIECAISFYGIGNENVIVVYSLNITRQAIPKLPNRQGSPSSVSVLERGSINGTVPDETGAVIVGANIKAIHRLSGEVFEAKSNRNGNYSFPNLPEGCYDISFEASGFKRTIVLEVPVIANTTTGLYTGMEPGESSEVALVMRLGNELPQRALPPMCTGRTKIFSEELKEFTERPESK